MGKYALALEGGGAKGAYQMGAVKALIENGYEFDAVVGTSIGSINAAMIAQKDFDIAYEVWDNIKYSDIFDIDDNKVRRALDINFDMKVIKYISKKFTNSVKNGGIDIGKMRKFLTERIDENKIRNSDIKFGLVTFNLSDAKPETLYIEDIPEGKLIDYILASCNLPVFQTVKINDKSFIDGGIYDNCPVEMLAERGYKDIIAIRLYTRNRIRNYRKLIKEKHLNIKMIQPREELPNLMLFDNKFSKVMLKQGYFDVLRILDNLDGFKYYIAPNTEEYYQALIFNNITDSEIKNIASALKIKIVEGESCKKVLLEKIIPYLVSKTDKKETINYKNTVIALVEYVLEKENVGKFEIYKIENVLNTLKNKLRFKDKQKYELAIYKFVKYLSN